MRRLIALSLDSTREFGSETTATRPAEVPRTPNRAVTIGSQKGNLNQTSSALLPGLPGSQLDQKSRLPPNRAKGFLALLFLIRRIAIPIAFIGNNGALCN